MDIKESLFEGKFICLAPIHPEKDAEIESRWTHDAEYLRLLSREPARPLSPDMVKKRYEAIEKEVDDDGDLFYFTIRLRPDDRLIGFARIYWIIWTLGSGFIQFGIGDPEQRGKGYGGEALSLLLRYAFCELNLFSLIASVPEYNPVALHLFQKAGFVEEVRLRQALYRDGRRWDVVSMGMLRDEYRV